MKQRKKSNKISMNVKKLQIHLKQFMEEEENDQILEASRIHNLDVYSDRIPLNIKISLKAN